MLLLGGLVTFCTAFATLALAHRVLKLPMEVALGLVAGVHTQPAALAFADEQTKSELPQRVRWSPGVAGVHLKRLLSTPG